MVASRSSGALMMGESGGPHHLAHGSSVCVKCIHSTQNAHCTGTYNTGNNRSITLATLSPLTPTARCPSDHWPLLPSGKHCLRAVPKGRWTAPSPGTRCSQDRVRPVSARVPSGGCQGVYREKCSPPSGQQGLGSAGLGARPRFCLPPRTTQGPS